MQSEAKSASGGKIENFKVAIFFDWLNQWGGAERLLLDMLSALPQADLYTSVWDKSKTPWLPPKTKVFTSGLDSIPFFRRNSPLSVALQPFFLEKFNFKNYQLVISLTSQNGHCLLTPPKTLFVCYHLNPNRYLYQLNKSSILKPVISLYQKLDQKYAQRPDFYLTSSNTVKERIWRIYRRQAKIVHPGVNTTFFHPTKNKTPNSYFLIVSRLVNHKRIDLAINACHQLKQNLVIAGSGRDEAKLKMIQPNSPFIKFIGQVDEKKLLSLYQKCIALICPQEEDFGLTPLEAMACGKPVIAFNAGGIASTILHKKTGLLFEKQTVKSLTKTINLLQKIRINKANCINQSQKFDRRQFMINFIHSLTTFLHDQPKVKISG